MESHDAGVAGGGGLFNFDNADARKNAGRDFLTDIGASLESAEPEYHAIEAPHSYRESSEGLIYEKPSRDGPTSVRLTNFLTRIKSEVFYDDDAECRYSFLIRTQLDGKIVEFSVSADRFATMPWVVEHLGARAIILRERASKSTHVWPSNYSANRKSKRRPSSCIRAGEKSVADGSTSILAT